MTIVRIGRRFCGPPDSGNGGYVAGLVAQELGGSNVTVTLRLPPPLDRDLELGSDGDTAWLKDGDALIASAERQVLDIDVPAAPTLAEAHGAEGRYAGFRTHAFPGCFVCGPDRAAADGLRIFPGSVPRANGLVAACWAAEQAEPGTPFIWAALDCPGFWAVAGAAGTAVLGRFTAAIHADPFPQGPLIVTGWPIASEGRKHEAGTAIHDSDGRLLAAARATWITLRN